MDDKIYPLNCPVCNIQSNDTMLIKESEEKKGLWYRCNCGVVWQKDKPNHGHYNKDYIAGYAGYKHRHQVQVHSARTYAPLIEELTMGRKLLDVGCCLTDNMEFFQDRGWIVEGIDINTDLDNANNIINDNFETYKDFKDEYNLVWMSHVLEHFDEPLYCLKKAYSLMPEDGVMFLATPDVDFCNKTGVASFPHWKKDEHYILWNERSLVRELERIGFNIVMKRRNYSSRFVSWYDVHIIAQKQYF